MLVQSPRYLALSYVIQLEDGRIVRQYVDYVKKRAIIPEVSTDLTPEPPDVSQVNEPESADESVVNSTQIRRSERAHKPPTLFQ